MAGGYRDVSGDINQSGSNANGVYSPAPIASGGGSAPSPSVTASPQTIPITNVSLTANTWGKVIPRTWGGVRVAGYVVWSSNFYKVTDNAFSSDARYSAPYEGGSSEAGTGTTIGGANEFAIDLAYSFGFEGNPADKRTIKKMSINGTVVFDIESGFVYPGIGFDIRYGYDDLRHPIMLRDKKNGIYWYTGQTLIIFEKFRASQWGGAIPQTIDVEFGKSITIGNYLDEPYFQEPEVDLTYLKAFLNVETRRVYYAEQALGKLFVFDMNTGDRLDDITVYGPAASAFMNQGGFIDHAFSHTTTGACEIAVFSTFGYQNVFYMDLRDGYCAQIPEVNNVHGISPISITPNEAVVLCGPFVTNTDVMSKITLTRSGGAIVVGVATVPNLYIGHDVGVMEGDGFGLILIYYDATHFYLYKDGQKYPVENPDNWTVLSFVVSRDKFYVHYRDAGVDRLVEYANTGLQIRLRIQDPIVVTTGGARQYHLKQMDKPARNTRVVNRRIACLTDNAATFTDLNSLTMRDVDHPGFFQVGYDGVRNQIIYSGPMGQFGFFGAKYTEGKINLIDFLRSLYVGTGRYNAGNISDDGSIMDAIVGAIIVTGLFLNDTVENICRLYRINKTEEGNNVYFYRNRDSAEGLDIALELNVNQLAVDSVEDDEYTAFRTIMGSTEDAPSAATLNFIDPDANYNQNSVTWKRTDVANQTGQPLVLSVPIVMPTPEALVIVQGVVLDAASNVMTHDFRLAPRHALLVGPGDIINVTNKNYVTTVQIDQHDLNGDYSASCLGTTIIAQATVDIEVPQTIPDPPTTVGSAVDATGYIIDAPLLQPEDSPANATDFIFYEGIAPKTAGNFFGGYFARKIGDAPYESLPSITSQDVLTVLRANGVMANKKWVKDTTPLSVSLLTGRLPVAATNAELQANARRNLAFYGKPGRWEVIQFESVTGGMLLNAYRGLRGTEGNCGTHAVGDFIVVPSGAFVAEARPILDAVDKVEVYRPVSVGKAFFNSTDLPSIVVKALSLYPFAPSALAGAPAAGGGLDLSWDRRDRLGSGWGAGALPMSEAVESYRVAITQPGNFAIEVRVAMTSTPFYAYSGADRATDGLTGPIGLKVQQIGALGPGFIAKKVIG